MKSVVYTIVSDEVGDYNVSGNVTVHSSLDRCKATLFSVAEDDEHATTDIETWDGDGLLILWGNYRGDWRVVAQRTTIDEGDDDGEVQEDQVTV